MANRTHLTVIPWPDPQPAGRPVAVGSTPVAHFRTLCTSCNLRDFCLPCGGLSQSRMQRASLMFARIRLRRGESLYGAGTRFTSLFAVRRGFLKTTDIMETGRDQVTGFALPGELLGMDGIHAGTHSCSAIAVEASEVCAISYPRLQDLMFEMPGLQRQFHKMMSREIVREHGVMLLLGQMNAEERLSALLLNLSRRLGAQTTFDLRLSRSEISSYLGLTVGTVCRIFTRFHARGLIGVERRVIHLLDRAGLEQIAGCSIGGSAPRGA